MTVTLGLPLNPPRIPLEVYAATLVITANLSGARYFMYVVQTLRWILMLCYFTFANLFQFESILFNCSLFFSPNSILFLLLRYHWFFTSAVVGVGALLALQLSLAVFAYAFHALTAPPAVAAPRDTDRRTSGTRPDSESAAPSPLSVSSSSSEASNNRSGTTSSRSDPPQNLDDSETQGLVQTTSGGVEVGGVGEFKESISVADGASVVDLGESTAALDSEEPNARSSC